MCFYYSFHVVFELSVYMASINKICFVNNVESLTGCNMREVDCRIFSVIKIKNQ